MSRTVHLIVVHGIGQQKVGMTVARWAGSLERFHRLRGEATNVVQTDLTGTPAEATVVVGAPEAEDPPPFSYRIVEAHWADAFPQPTPQRLLRWLLLVAPGVALLQACVLLRGASGSSRSHKVSAAFRSLTMVLPILAGVVLLVVAAPLVLLLVALLLLASLFPVPAVRKAVGSLLGTLAGTIGDAFLFVADPVSRGAMVTKVGERIDAIAADKSDPEAPIVLLAHSQGAAVMHRALSAPGSLARVKRLKGVATVGSGIGRLTNDFTLKPPPWTFLANVVALGGWVILGAEMFAAVPVPGRWTWLVALVVAVVASGATTSYWWRRSRAVSEPGDLGGVAWLDLWAPSDLVPSGRLFPAGSSTYEALNVPAELSVVRDHTRYSTDFSESMPALVGFIAQVAFPLSEARATATRPSLRNTPSQNPRRTYANRDWVALGLRLLPLFVAVGLLLRSGTGERREFGHWLLIALPDPVTGSLDTVISPVRSVLTALQGAWQNPPHVDAVIAVLAVLAVGLVGAFAVRWSVGMLEEVETRQWLESGYDRVWSPRLWAVALAPVAAASVLIAAGLIGVGVRSHWSPDQAVSAYLSGVSEGDPTRICDVLDNSAASDLTGAPGASCTEAATAYLAAVCADARTAHDSVSVEVLGQGDRRTTLRSWAPEAAPGCDAAPNLVMLLPAELVHSGDEWVISRLCGAGSCPIK